MKLETVKINQVNLKQKTKHMETKMTKINEVNAYDT